MGELDIGAWIKEKRLKKGLTKIALAEAIEVNPSYIYYLESNDRVPSLEILVKIAEVTGGKIILK